MPTVTLNRKVVEEILGKRLPAEELKERIAMLGTDLEHLDENEIIVEVFPNRPDMLNEQGFARALRSFLGIKSGILDYKVKKSGMKVIVDSSVKMRPYTACAVVYGLKFDDERIREVMQVQEKLATTHGRNRKKSAYGIYPLKNIAFPVRYTAKDPEKVEFHPLGFNKTVKASLVPEIHPKGKAYSHLTKGWNRFPFFIDNLGRVMSMIPFTNSENTGRIEKGTTDVFIECTGTDMDNVKLALNIIVTMLADMGGSILSIEIKYPKKTITTPDLTPKRIKLDLKYINSILGFDLSKKDAVKWLGRMGYSFKKDEVLVPSYRGDIIHQVDLAEDIAIAYGYQSIPAEISRVASTAEEAPMSSFIYSIKNTLIGCVLQEIRTYHLLSYDELNPMMNLDKPVVTLKNAIVDTSCLRNSIIPSLLKILAQNQHYEYPQNLFETGKTFHKNPDDEYGVEERDTLCVVICHEKADLTSIRQILDVFCISLKIKCDFRESENSSFIEGRVADIILGSNIIGHIGELHPKVLTNFNLFMPVAAAELNLNAVYSAVSEKKVI